MKTKHSAFTLIELLVTITIIGMLSSMALLVLKDTVEVKALSYTKKAMIAIEDGISDVDSDGYIQGFVNDFGTLPPFLGFLAGSEDGNYNFVGGELKRVRFIDMTKQSSTKFPAPFMPEDDSPLKDNINKVLFAGFHGGYLGSVQNPLDDGWQTKIKMQNNMNISVDNTDGKNFLTLISAGSDSIFNESGIEPLLNEEFDFAQEETSIEKLYADDYNDTFRKNNFIISSLDIDIRLDVDDANETAIIIYSPMLYYADKIGGCNENNETHAECGGIDVPYEAYYPFPDDFTDIADRNVSWQIGLMKQVLYFNENNESRLYINEKGITRIDAEAYDFNATNEDYNLSDSIFFGDIKVDINNTNYLSSSKDNANPFYLYAGTKVVSIWYKSVASGSDWKKQESFIKDFKPNKKEKIKNYAGN